MGNRLLGNMPGEIADVVAETVTPEAVRRLNDARVLWVDDRPENNISERRAGSSWCSFHAEYVY